MHIPAATIPGQVLYPSLLIVMEDGPVSENHTIPRPGRQVWVR